MADDKIFSPEYPQPEATEPQAAPMEPPARIQEEIENAIAHEVTRYGTGKPKRLITRLPLKDA